MEVVPEAWSLWQHWEVTFGISLGSLWGHSEVTSTSLWGSLGGWRWEHVGVTLDRFWRHSGPKIDPCFLSLFPIFSLPRIASAGIAKRNQFHWNLNWTSIEFQAKLKCHWNFIEIPIKLEWHFNPNWNFVGISKNLSQNINSVEMKSVQRICSSQDKM